MENNLFKKYPSLTNHYQEKFVEDIYIQRYGEELSQVYWDKLYCIEEKVHWSNFQFIVDIDNNITCATRNNILNEWEKFFDWETLLLKYKENILNDTREIRMRERVHCPIHFFWEYYGWSYGNKKAKNSATIQKWVYYSPENHFILFDVFVNDDKWICPYFLPKNDLDTLKEKGLLKLPLIETIKIESFKNLMSIDVELFESEIYKIHWLDKIENNIAEWIIIRPYYQNFYNNYGERIIVKKKSMKFKEVSREPKREKSNKTNNYDEFSIEFNKLLKDIDSFLNENRIQSVKSKGFSNFWEELKEFSTDVNKEYNELNWDKIDLLNKDELKILKKELGKKSIEYYKKSVIWK